MYLYCDKRIGRDPIKTGFRAHKQWLYTPTRSYWASCVQLYKAESTKGESKDQENHVKICEGRLASLLCRWQFKIFGQAELQSLQNRKLGTRLLPHQPRGFGHACDVSYLPSLGSCYCTRTALLQSQLASTSWTKGQACSKLNCSETLSGTCNGLQPPGRWLWTSTFLITAVCKKRQRDKETKSAKSRMQKCRNAEMRKWGNEEMCRASQYASPEVRGNTRDSACWTWPPTGTILDATVLPLRATFSLIENAKIHNYE